MRAKPWRLEMAAEQNDAKWEKQIRKQFVIFSKQWKNSGFHRIPERA